VLTQWGILIATTQQVKGLIMYYDITQVTYSGIYHNVHDNVYDTVFVFTEDELIDTDDSCSAFIRIADVLYAYTFSEYALS
jgi:hypothetical protein